MHEHLPIPGGVSPGRDLWKQRAGGAGNTGRGRPCRVSPRAILPREAGCSLLLRLSFPFEIPDVGKCPRGAVPLAHFTSPHQFTWRSTMSIDGYSLLVKSFYVVANKKRISLQINENSARWKTITFKTFPICSYRYLCSVCSLAHTQK